MSKIDVNDYKNEDVSNISKEDTPIVKYLEHRQNVSYLITILALFLFLASALVLMDINRYLGFSVSIFAAIVIACGVIYNCIIMRKKDKIKKWQKEELMRIVRERMKSDECES